MVENIQGEGVYMRIDNFVIDQSEEVEFVVAVDVAYSF